MNSAPGPMGALWITIPCEAAQGQQGLVVPSVSWKFEYFVNKLKQFLIAQRYSSETVFTEVTSLYQMEVMIQNHGIMDTAD